MTRLIIQKDSWHYKYYSFIRSFWGFTELPERTSLCPYCQTMLWLSLLSFIASPFMLGGWLLIKGYRLLYGSMVYRQCDKIVDILDSTLTNTFEKASHNMEESAGVTSAGIFVSLCVLLAVVVSCLFVVWNVLFSILSNILIWPVYAWHGILYAFNCLFYVFAGIGQAFYAVGYGVYWLTTNPVTWIAVFYTISSVIAATVIVFVLWKVMQTNAGKKIKDFLIFKLNGFDEAREQAQSRKATVNKVDVGDNVDAGDKDSKESNAFIKTCKFIIAFPLICIVMPIVFITDIFEDRNEKLGSFSAKMLTPFGIFWEWIKGIKKKVCPIVDILDKNLIDMANAVFKEVEDAGGEDKLERGDSYWWRRSDPWDSWQMIGIWIGSKPSLTKKDVLVSTFLENYDESKPVPLKLKLLIAKYILGEISPETLLTTVTRIADNHE